MPAVSVTGFQFRVLDETPRTFHRRLLRIFFCFGPRDRHGRLTIDSCCDDRFDLAVPASSSLGPPRPRGAAAKPQSSLDAQWRPPSLAHVRSGHRQSESERISSRPQAVLAGLLVGESSTLVPGFVPRSSRMRCDGESVSQGQKKEGKETRGIDDADGRNAPHWRIRANAAAKPLVPFAQTG